MIKKTVKYKDLESSEEVTEDLYFHIFEHEIYELHAGGIEATLKELIKPDAPATETLAKFKEFVGFAYGIKADGKKFRKSKAITEEFLNSQSYNAFFMDILSGGDAASIAFVQGVFPADLVAAVAGNILPGAGIKVDIPVVNPQTQIVKTGPSLADVYQQATGVQLENTVPEAFRAKPDPLAGLSTEELEAALARRKASS